MFCTAYSEYAIDAWKIHAKGYLLKPVIANKIEETINEIATKMFKHIRLNS